jgi:hypothetical protein
VVSINIIHCDEGTGRSDGTKISFAVVDRLYEEKLFEYMIFEQRFSNEVMEMFISMRLHGRREFK